MKLITISGLDGSGKTTQIENLKKYFEAQGKKVHYFHTINFSLANKIASGGKTVAPGEKKAVTKAGFFSILLRKIFFLIDLYRFKYLYNNLQQQYDYTLSDRYFYDQMVNILYLEGKKPPLQESFWQRTALRLLITPDIAVYLRVSPPVIMQRQREVEQGLDYLKQKMALYDAFYEIAGLEKLNGEDDRDYVFQKVISLLDQD